MSTFSIEYDKIGTMKGNFSWLRRELKKRGSNISKLALRIGADQSNLSKIVSSGNASLDTYDDIAKAMRLPLQIVLSQSGIIPPLDEEIEEIIKIFGRLTPEQKDDILDYARFKLDKRE